MSEAEKLITRLVLRTVEPMPASERAKHYRALASLSSDDVLAGSLANLASNCEALDAAHLQMTLDFEGRTTATPKN